MRTPTSGATWLALLGVAMLLTTTARSQEFFRAWAGLYEPALTGWLENENRISDLCADVSDVSKCHQEMLAPKVSTYPLYRAPEESSFRIGDLIVVAVPGRGLSAYFRPTGSRDGLAFTPDLFLQDWGYGPYFHHTVSAQHGDWIQLPPDPWDEAVWLRRDHETSSIIAVQPNDLIEMNGSSWFVMATEPDALTARPEQPGDMWCEPGDPPPTIPTEPTRFSRAELVDSRGHLLFQLKNLKGC